MSREMTYLLGWGSLLLLFPGGALGCAALLHYGYKQVGAAVPTLIGAVLTYLLALFHVFYFPHWLDQGATNGGTFLMHFSCAWVESVLLQLFVIPPVVVIYRIFASVGRERENTPGLIVRR